MERAAARRLITEVLAGIAPEIDPDTVDGGAELQFEFDLDSIDFLRLVDEVSGAIGHDIPERDYPEVATLDGFTTYVAGRAP